MKAPGNREELERMSLTDLVGHLVSNYHDYSRAMSEEIGQMAEGEFSRNFTVFSEEFLFHLKKEEMILFPFIQAIEKKSKNPDYVFSQNFPPTVAMPVRMMMMEHETHHADADKLLKMAEGENCFEKMAEFHDNIMRHMYIENEILFPRSMELEKNQG